MMLSRWPIRYKLTLGGVLLLLMVAILSINGFRGVYAYRHLARVISQRALEMPASDRITQHVQGLRHAYADARSQPSQSIDIQIARQEFSIHQSLIDGALDEYEILLRRNANDEVWIGDVGDELGTVGEIRDSLQVVQKLVDERDPGWVFKNFEGDQLSTELDHLHGLVSELPVYLHRRMSYLQSEVKSKYRTWIVLAWVSSVSAVVILVGLALFFNWSIFRPLRFLVRDSRRVAKGEFDHRIELSTQDEMAELAQAMNGMTTRFREIRDDLDGKVRQRTQEVVRSEQLASVGFLAAGVAHEINNPLASIAWSAESLESRLVELYEEVGCDDDHEFHVVRTYLRRIQEEAFRCKEITEKLLDFSRLGPIERVATDMKDLVQGVVDMVSHIGTYREKTVRCQLSVPVIAEVHPQEMKQVVLNLLTNALDSVDEGGEVDVRLDCTDDELKFVVTDQGCGMPPHVIEHLFEPFYTRRRDGQGTGLGLSITYRIIQDHGGTIAATSRGPGYGSEFTMELPLRVKHDEEVEQAHAA
ncbi:MAG: HAMP domain-containing sensor histidine kinase [Pirellulaceae bacterium]